FVQRNFDARAPKFRPGSACLITKLRCTCIKVSYAVGGGIRTGRKPTRKPTLPRVPKWMKLILAVLLLPFCIGASSALVRVVRATSAADHFWVVFVGGAACWMVVFLLLPRPMLLYVFGHELTHVLWTWLFGGKVKKFKA